MTLLEWLKIKVDSGLLNKSDCEYLKDKRVFLYSSVRQPTAHLKFEWWIQDIVTGDPNSNKVTGFRCSHFTMGRRYIPLNIFMDQLVDFMNPDEDGLDAMLFKLQG